MPASAKSPLLDGLIASKLSAPTRDSRLILRTSFVAAALDDLPRSRLIAIVAAAGSGKSTLMSELQSAFTQHQLATTWLGLDAEENDPATFTLYFISAMQAIEPGFAQDELTALGANPMRDFDLLFDRLAGRLSALSMPAAIFLDDFQHISDPRILRFLDRLISHLPRNLSLAIASRHRLPLQIARLMVAGTVIEVNQDDLHFDRSQTELFLQRYHQLQLSSEEIDALVHSTEGWPAGVQLAALALRRHPGRAADLIKTFSGRDRDLTRYLVESVLRSQPESIRNFLLHTSPLRRMNAALCTATTGQADSHKTLRYIGDANLFLIPLDRNGHWYRYHHLFAEFLRNEFLTNDREGYRGVCSRAASWCEVNGYPTEAIRYALDAEHFEQATDLIAHHAMNASLFRGDHYTVLDWMRVLPEEFHTRRPEIMLSHAWSCAFARNTERAMQLSQQAIDELSAGHPRLWKLATSERERWLFWALNVQAATKACSDDIEECVSRATALLPKVPRAEPFLIATLSNCLSYGYFALRDFERSRQHAIYAHEQGHLANSAYLSAWGDFLHGLVDVELGELRAASRVGRQVYRDSEGLGLGQKGYVSGLSALLDAEIAVQQCDFDKATEHVAVGRAFKDIFGPVEPQLVALRSEARLHAYRNRLDLGLHVLREGQDAALRERHRRLHLALSIEDVSLQLTFGDIDGAAASARRTKLLDPEMVDSELSRPQRGALRLIEARLKLARGEVASAMRQLTTLLQARGAEYRGGFFLSVSAHRALALWNSGQHGDATRQLDRALIAAAAEFHAYPIASVGRPLLPILEAINERRTEAPAPNLQSVLALQNWLTSHLQGGQTGSHITDATVTAEVDGAVEVLTSRELELLRLLHAGLTNQQLADALLVSVPTVKWHLHNTYGKLGVSSRGAAVAAAAKMRLI